MKGLKKANREKTNRHRGRLEERIRANRHTWTRSRHTLCWPLDLEPTFDLDTWRHRTAPEHPAPMLTRSHLYAYRAQQLYDTQLLTLTSHRKWHILSAGSQPVLGKNSVKVLTQYFAYVCGLAVYMNPILRVTTV